MSQKSCLFEMLNRRTSSDGTWYCGIDFANDIETLGVCLIEENIQTRSLTVHAISERPPVVNRTKGLLHCLFADNDLLEKDKNGRLILPSGEILNRASNASLLQALRDPALQQRLKAIDQVSRLVGIPELLSKVGLPTVLEDKIPDAAWHFLFEAVPLFGRLNYSDHDETNRIAFMCWLAEQEMGKDARVRLTAIDSPLGTCCDFVRVLRGELPATLADEKLKERTTERYWRARLNDFARMLPGTPSYFNSASHLKSSVGLEIVPECVYCVLKSLGQDELKNARMGNAKARMIEAAPRVFLYCIIERMRRHDELRGTQVVTPQNSVAVKNYKSDDVANRRIVLELLTENFEIWSGGTYRKIKFSVDREMLLQNDHLFDAWLSAMTAWTHCQGETLSATDANLSQQVVELEGHIIGLR